MRKSSKIVVTVVILLFLVVCGAGMYIVRTPEYTLLQAKRAIEKSGIEGLHPYLTQEAQEKVDLFFAITENEFVGAILEALNQSESVQAFREKIREVEWEVDEIRKSSKSADVVLAFDYQDKLGGTVELTMIREDGKWKIDEIGYPEFHEVHW